FHYAFAHWLAQPGVTIACGRWADGAISEIMPRGQAQLLPARYDGCFSGVRELRLADQPHHLHIDFGRVHALSYAVVPSVCLAFRPSFELRFLMIGPGNAPTDRWAVSLMLAAPYVQGVLDRDAVLSFFQRVQHDAALRPDLVEFIVDPAVRACSMAPQILSLLQAATGQSPGTSWQEALSAMCPGSSALSPEAEPLCLPVLQQALALRDASLVIFRDRALIEFKTDRLAGLHRYEEQGHVSWQIGALDDHHRHLSLGAVVRVLFSAEPVSCQGGGLNYTVWFLSAGSSGNPYRRDGYFSVVLNRPYTGDAARREVIDPVLALYRRFRHEPWVQADETFLRVLDHGPPDRHAAQAVEAAAAPA
nr:hypothetical protein [Burkholderiaceae bacterium]